MYVVILEERVVEVPGELMRGLAEREAFESQRRALAHLEIVGHSESAPPSNKASSAQTTSPLRATLATRPDGPDSSC